MELKKNLSCKYVFFASLDITCNDFWHIMYNDLQGKERIKYIDTPFEKSSNSLLKIIHKYHYHDYLNKIVELPFKSLWNSFYYNEKCDKPHELCFVFFMTSLTRYNEPFFKYLKANYPGCKLVVYFDDIVSAFKKVWSFDYSLADKYFDLKISYDEGDCKRYGFLFYPTPYSVVEIKDNPTISQSDLFFCGAAKQRYVQITDIFRCCSQNDIKSDFIVARYGDNKKLDGIKYVTYVIPYRNYLEHMIKSNCLLDIIQEGSRGFTIRTWEALVYGKKLLSNNPEILNAPFYDENQFCYFESFGKKELDFIKQPSHITPRYQEELSPLRLIEFIEDQLIRNK